MLLDYLISTAPQPLQIGTTTRPATGTIDIYVSEPKTPVYCNEIVVAVRVGDDDRCLFAQPPSGAVNTGKWAQTSFEIVDGRSLGLAAGAYAKFVYDCLASTDYDITYNLVFSLTGTLANMVGDSAILVQETAGTVNKPAEFKTNQGQFSVSLALPQFYLNNFVATVTGSPTAPCTEFANSVTINFAWESNGTWFQLFKKGETAPFYSGAATTYTLTLGVATDTTFFLVASVSGDPGGDKPVAGYEQVFLYDALAITISNPDLTPKTVTSSGNATVGGALSVTGKANLAATVVTAGLSVTGGSTADKATVSGTLDVAGATTLAALNAAAVSASSVQTPSLNASSATLGATAVTGLTATGGAVSMFGGFQPLTPGTKWASPATYTAPTDGLVLGVIGFPPNYWTGGCMCRGYGQTGGATTYTTGGNVGFFGPSWDDYMGSNPNSFILPVPRGNPFYVAIEQGTSSGQQVDAPYWYYWMPIGAGPAGSLVREPTIGADFVPPPLPKSDLVRGGSRAEFIDILERLLGKEIDKETRGQLLALGPHI